MVSQIGSILRKSYLKDEEKLNILTFVTHERYEPNLCLTNHNFYSITGKNIRQWNTNVSPIPDNYRIYEIDYDNENLFHKLPIDIDIDCIITQNRFMHMKLAKHIQNNLNIPIISIEHTDTMPNWPEEYVKELSELQGDINIYISEYNKERWMSKNGIVIEHMIDTDTFCPGVNIRQDYILSMCNDWKNRDIPCGYKIWENIISGLPYKVIGKTPGLSIESPSLQACVKEFQNASIFLNTSQYSPIPMSLLEAMSCGCAIVSSATCMIPEIIENGENGFISNDISKLKKYLNDLLYDKELCKYIGNNARNTIINRFNKNRFLKGWDDVFNSIRNCK